MDDFVYVLDNYRFFETPELVIVSLDYEIVKKEFNKLKYEVFNEGLSIYKIKLDKILENDAKDYLDWVEVEEFGKIRNMLEEFL